MVHLLTGQLLISFCFVKQICSEYTYHNSDSLTYMISVTEMDRMCTFYIQVVLNLSDCVSDPETRRSQSAIHNECIHYRLSQAPCPLALLMIITYPQMHRMHRILLHIAVITNVPPPSDCLLWYYLSTHSNGNCKKKNKYGEYAFECSVALSKFAYQWSFPIK